MNRKRVAAAIAVLLLAVSLAACSAKAAVTVAGEKLNYMRMDLSDNYRGIVPSGGNQMLILRFAAQSESPDLYKISEAFFGMPPSTLSNGTDSYTCQSISFEKNTERVIVTLLFEVPSDFETVPGISLSGNEFSPIQLTE